LSSFSLGMTGYIVFRQESAISDIACSLARVLDIPPKLNSPGCARRALRPTTASVPALDDPPPLQLGGPPVEPGADSVRAIPTSPHSPGVRRFLHPGARMPPEREVRATGRPPTGQKWSGWIGVTGWKYCNYLWNCLQFWPRELVTVPVPGMGPCTPGRERRSCATDLTRNGGSS